MSIKRLKTLALLVLLLCLQVSLFAHLRPFGVAPDALLVAAIVGGILGGPDYGVRNGFAAGLLLDLVVPGAFGLAAGVYGVFGYGVGFIARALDSEDPRVLPVLVAMTSFLATGTYGLALGVLGSEQFVEWGLVATAIGVSVFSVVLTVPVRNGYRWVLASRNSAARTEAGHAVVN